MPCVYNFWRRFFRNFQKNIFRKTTKKLKKAHCRCPSAGLGPCRAGMQMFPCWLWPEQQELGTAVPVLGCHRKARGHWCHTWAALQHQPGVGRCQNVLWDCTQKQVALAALQFVSLVCPQQLQKWDYWHPCLFLMVSADGNPAWELPCPFLSPLKLSVSTPPVLTDCRSSLLFGWSEFFHPFYYCGLWWKPSPCPLPLGFCKPCPRPPQPSPLQGKRNTQEWC